MINLYRADNGIGPTATRYLTTDFAEYETLIGPTNGWHGRGVCGQISTVSTGLFTKPLYRSHKHHSASSTDWLYAYHAEAIAAEAAPLNYSSPVLLGYVAGAPAAGLWKLNRLLNNHGVH